MELSTSGAKATCTPTQEEGSVAVEAASAGRLGIDVGETFEVTGLSLAKMQSRGDGCAKSQYEQQT